MRAWGWTCIVVALAAPGCAVQYVSSAGSAVSSTSAQVSISSGSALGNALLLGIVLGETVEYYRFGSEGRMSAGALELDPGRKVSVQDCTRPVDASAGNLMCR